MIPTSKSPELSQLLDTPELPRELEAKLARRARSGDAKAREQLIISQLHSVRLHVLRLGFVGERFDDALQDGVLGLISAVDRFDPDQGARLRTFAWPWVSGAVLRHAQQRVQPLITMGQFDESHDDLMTALTGLAPELRAVLTLRFGLGSCGRVPLSRRETAQNLGCSESQVRNREKQALADLRLQLAARV